MSATPFSVRGVSMKDFCQQFTRKTTLRSNRTSKASESSEANFQLYYLRIDIPDQLFPEYIMVLEDLRTNTCQYYSLERNSGGDIISPLKWKVTTTPLRAPGTHTALCKLSTWNWQQAEKAMVDTINELNTKPEPAVQALFPYVIAYNLDWWLTTYFLGNMHRCGFMDDQSLHHVSEVLQSSWKHEGEYAWPRFDQAWELTKEGLTALDGKIDAWREQWEGHDCGLGIAVPTQMSCGLSEWEQHIIRQARRG
ncbi:hypothetical protein VFPPC_14061 [Pochonia chlamydosporia 170]|uniref:Uncharacterized protein n=1 Tax=Pochonia chlamydosporia 170 TaxID=1380566 RepID=A0A179FIN6_METCM|nr:hypothetical protein VFPPC_14061 [Pochonia chlamydosporia 170]OAQ65402.1 hypothetical protein VFPPC_14061 [Pochonia chlamydosporia 170]